MSHTPTPPSGHAGYFAAITDEEDRLAATLAAIRADEAAGHLTVLEAAANRVAALETHLAKVGQLRERYLGD